MHQERQRMAGQCSRLLMLLCWCAGMPSGQQQSAALPAPPVDVATRSGHAQNAGQTELPATPSHHESDSAGSEANLVTAAESSGAAAAAAAAVSMAWSFLIEHMTDQMQGMSSGLQGAMKAESNLSCFCGHIYAIISAPIGGMTPTFLRCNKLMSWSSVLWQLANALVLRAYFAQRERNKYSL